VTASSIPHVKRLVRSVTVEHCVRIARKACSLDSDLAISAYLRDQRILVSILELVRFKMSRFLLNNMLGEIQHPHPLGDSERHARGRLSPRRRLI
jgi:hypothetical protein